MRTIDNSKSLAGHIVVIALSLVVMIGGICVLVRLAVEDSKSYEIWICCIIIVLGIINSVRSGLAIRKIKESRKK